MALADITLTDSQASPVNHVMVYTGTVNGRVVRSQLDAAPETPCIFTIAHKKTTKNGVTMQSHLAKLEKTVLDADGITPYTNNIRMMSDIHDPVLSDAECDDLRAMFLTWCTEANFRLFCRGSVF